MATKYVEAVLAVKYRVIYKNNTMIGLVLILTGTWNIGKTGAELTTIAFSRGLPGEWGMAL